MCAVAVAAIAVVATTAIGAPAGAEHPSRARAVAVGSNFYDPVRLTVARGQRVRFLWEGGILRHDVSVRRGPEHFRSPLQAAGSYSRRFRKPGRFSLYCTQHPSSMRMTLVVRR